MEENLGELFKREDYIKKEHKADYAFSKSYRNMTDEVERVTKEEVTIWWKLASFIYWKIFKNPKHVKAKQDNFDKFRSAKAFRKIKGIFQPIESNSMDNQQIMDHTKDNF
ncbi:MAG: hypothetical protein AAF518_09840 [Spirochaetota bacterium]